MVSNIAIIDGHPHVSEGADDAHLTLVGNRVYVVSQLAENVIIERSTDNGDTWETVVGNINPGEGANLIDWESPSYGDIRYRATAITADGASAETIITVEARSEAIWLSGGAGYGTTARLPMNPTVAHTSGRQRALKQWAGRALPVPVTGEAIGRTVSVSGDITDRDYGTATPEQLRNMSQLGSDVFLFRDPDGRRIYGQIGEIQIERKTAISTNADKWNAIWGYGFTLTETNK